MYYSQHHLIEKYRDTESLLMKRTLENENIHERRFYNYSQHSEMSINAFEDSSGELPPTHDLGPFGRSSYPVLCNNRSIDEEQSEFHREEPPFSSFDVWMPQDFDPSENEFDG